MRGSIIYFPVIHTSGNHFKGDKYCQLRSLFGQGSLFGQQIHFLILANALSKKAPSK